MFSLEGNIRSCCALKAIVDDFNAPCTILTPGKVAHVEPFSLNDLSRHGTITVFKLNRGFKVPW